MQNLIILIKKYWKIIVILIIPALIYFYKFHYGLSNSQNDWASFGSYLAGIYAFIAVFATLYLILKQNNDIFLKDRKEDIKFYLDKINLLLENPMEDWCKNNLECSTQNIYIDDKEIEMKNATISQLLRYLKKQQKEIEEYKNKRLFGILRSKNKEYKQLLDDLISIITNARNVNNIWFIILSTLNDIYKRGTLYSEFETERMKIAITLSLDVCIALDNYHFHTQEKDGHEKLPLFFLDWNKYC